MDPGMEALRLRMERLLASLSQEVATVRWRPHGDQDAVEGFGWPPEDADQLVQRWAELGRPEVPASTGGHIPNLKGWLYAGRGRERTPEKLAEVRRYLWERLPPEEISQANPLLEEWRWSAIPCWKHRLAEAEGQGNDSAVAYARWMLREVLEDPECQETGT